MFPRFGLVLMLNHACNLECSYCYTGLKFNRPMPTAVLEKSIRRACQSIADGGVLELGFFGGEPFIEAELIQHATAFAGRETRRLGLGLLLNVTTNGTVTSPLAWQIMIDPAMDLAISFDGLPEIHDRHRPFVDGRPSSAVVLATVRQLRRLGKRFNVISVVRPDTVEYIADGLRFLQSEEVEMVDLSLDLWTPWPACALEKLEAELAKAADVWRSGLPQFGVNWFNEKTVELCQIPVGETARCGFGKGEVAVAPSGNLYPCERLIGEDRVGNTARMPGTIFDGNDFLNLALPSLNTRGECEETVCGLSCSCSNFVRTGSTERSDSLLNRLDRVCSRETRRVLGGRVA